MFLPCMEKTYGISGAHLLCIIQIVHIQCILCVFCCYLQLYIYLPGPAMGISSMPTSVHSYSPQSLFWLAHILHIILCNVYLMSIICYKPLACKQQMRKKTSIDYRYTCNPINGLISLENSSMDNIQIYTSAFGY